MKIRIHAVSADMMCDGGELHPPSGLPARRPVQPVYVTDVICAPLLGSQNRTLHHILTDDECFHADLHADNDAKDIDLKHSDNEQGRKPRRNPQQDFRSRLYRRTEFRPLT